MAVTSERTGRPAGLQAGTVAEAFQVTAEAHPDRCALRTKGDEFSMSWREYAEKVKATAAGLAGLGLERGGTIALMLTNRPEFHWFDAAAMHLGATPFSIYNTYTSEQIQYQVDDAGARILVTEEAFADRVEGLTGVEHLIVVERGGVEEHAAKGFDFDAAWKAVEPDDLLTLIYTSGTTGPPKGVELTHSNLMAEMDALEGYYSIGHDDTLVSYLPDAHIANRWGAHYSNLRYGIQITTVDDPKQLVATLPSVRPTFFGGVPAVW